MIVVAETLTVESLGGLQVTSVVEKLTYINMIIYGDPGAGKTVLAGSADAVPEMRPVIFIDVEGGTFSLRERYPDVNVVRVQNWKDMQSVYDALLQTDHGYKTVVLDSLTEIQKFSMYNIMKRVVAENSDRDPDIPSMREWGKNIEQLRLLVRAFRDLPMHTIFTALAKTDKDSKTGASRTKPYMSGKLADEVAAFVDIVGYQYIKVVDSNLKRFLLTSSHETFVAKDRSDNLPQTIEEPTMGKIFEYAYQGSETT